jgi:hypothetical protein
MQLFRTFFENLIIIIAFLSFMHDIDEFFILSDILNLPPAKHFTLLLTLLFKPLLSTTPKPT